MTSSRGRGPTGMHWQWPDRKARRPGNQMGKVSEAQAPSLKLCAEEAGKQELESEIGV